VRNPYHRSYSNASPVPVEATALTTSLKHDLLSISSVLCNAARKTFTVKDYYIRIKRELFILIFMAQNRTQ